MTRQDLIDEAPKVFHALARVLTPADLALVIHDYQCAREAGGNAEQGLQREQGVSYNPRLARLLSIVISDAGIRDLPVIRAALYAATLETGLTLDVDGPTEARQHLLSHPGQVVIPAELREVVLSALALHSGERQGAVIRSAIALDAIRHLHQSLFSLSQREAILNHNVSNVLDILGRSIPQTLFKKLEHAIHLQQRRLASDQQKA